MPISKLILSLNISLHVQLFFYIRAADEPPPPNCTPYISTLKACKENSSSLQKENWNNLNILYKSYEKWLFSPYNSYTEIALAEFLNFYTVQSLQGLSAKRDLAQEPLWERKQCVHISDLSPFKRYITHGYFKKHSLPFLLILTIILRGKLG